MLGPSAFSLGPFDIHFYGGVILSALIFSVIIAKNEARFHREKEAAVLELLSWVFVPGLIGARLYHVLHFWEFYQKNLWEIFALWKGGLAIFGALFGGLVGLFLASKRFKLDFSRWLDIAAPALALGQAIGRWGNFFNREIYGRPTGLPWRLYIEPEYRTAVFSQESYFHPLFLYESLLNFLNFFLLIFFSRRFRSKFKRGDLFLVYLFNYSLIRFSLESLRFDNWRIFNIPAAQIISLLLLLATFSLFLYRHLSRRRLRL